MRQWIRQNYIFITSVLSIIAVASYFLHVIIGRIYNEDYHWMSQAISDLTASDASNTFIIRLFSSMYGLFSVVTIWIIYHIATSPFKKGVFVFGCMLTLSAIGYTLFPLSSSGFNNTFQDYMHMVITGLVVVLTIIGLLLLIIGAKKSSNTIFFTLSSIALLTIVLSGALMAVVSPSYFGLLERFSVYTVVLYFLYLVQTILWMEKKRHYTD